MVFKGSDAPVTILGDKVKRKMLAYGNDLMMVEVIFSKDGIGTPHSHAEHEQVSYIVKGSFKVTIGDETKIVMAGDGFYAARDVMHGVVALEEDSRILDTFTPIRKEFL
jgi:quercetin dioxygenase-like cupin family protein